TDATITSTVKVPPTETEKGEEERVCSVCQTKETRTVPELSHKHTLTKVAAKAATATEAGNKEYYVCSGCDQWFEDAAGTKLIEDHTAVVIAAGTSSEAPAATDAETDAESGAPSPVIWIVLAIVLVVLAAACVVVFLVLRKKKAAQ
ncbi:MAG: hypothetical protein J6X61_00545, partial [Clostridia bacterium]|nr:hypothetical protein [Clostridia bacterium]